MNKQHFMVIWSDRNPKPGPVLIPAYSATANTLENFQCNNVQWFEIWINIFSTSLPSRVRIWTGTFRSTNVKSIYYVNRLFLKLFIHLASFIASWGKEYEFIMPISTSTLFMISLLLNWIVFACIFFYISSVFLLGIYDYMCY